MIPPASGIFCAGLLIARGMRGNTKWLINRIQRSVPSLPMLLTQHVRRAMSLHACSAATRLGEAHCGIRNRLALRGPHQLTRLRVPRGWTALHHSTKENPSSSTLLIVSTIILAVTPLALTSDHEDDVARTRKAAQVGSGYEPTY
jgi:hypothetical protein